MTGYSYTNTVPCDQSIYDKAPDLNTRAGTSYRELETPIQPICIGGNQR